MRAKTLKQFVNTLGPGLLWAGAAIGVSHLVQSTRSGANYGFTLVWVIFLAHLAKYPFFEFGPRYVAATGNSLVEGYKQLGNWAVILLILMTVGTMFIVQAAITAVTAGLMNLLIPIALTQLQWSLVLLIVCASILALGHYHVLDVLIKVIILVLALFTFLTVFIAGVTEPRPLSALFGPFSWRHSRDIIFLIGFMGWMPCPLDNSVWHSLWAKAKNKLNMAPLSWAEAKRDFLIGYLSTMILAVAFVGLGTFVMFHSGDSFQPGAVGFARQLIFLFTHTIGDWAYPIILTAAFCTMFSTTLTVLDAYPRVLRQASELAIWHQLSDHREHQLYWGWLAVVIIGTLVILKFFMQNMIQMVMFATILSFVMAPVLAILNYLVINHHHVDEHFHPKGSLKALSWFGMVFLSAFTLWYLLMIF